MSSAWVACVLVAVTAACSSGGKAGGATTGSGSAGSGSAAPHKGSAGGFSASLSAELKGSDAKGSAAPTPTPTPTPAPAGSAAPTPAPAGSAAPVAKAGSAAPTPTPMPTPAPAGSAAKPATADTGSVAAATPAELAMIKFELLPNWERDVVAPGSFSLTVKVPKTGEQRQFVFGYGYDDPKAPSDRDQYKKWLADAKLLEVKVDRQRGAAWYLEGADPTGVGVFRFLVIYGGKRLICYGSLYKDAASNPLGDIRDEVLVQAKKICESLSL